ncbi:RGS domain-containing protein [Plasmodiophora brassicae]|uniref:RGS domain-containing protein n=1 Tax=Plasmodiophora brassicae TaxID=37360 RepID=A0A0G4J6P0_PLABS|nr:hypothetical protein PBRA_002927 [Plasmodiophora brassicae]SPQ95412.1 unnamed protein product [Plasmodiophora brassicae]
MEVGVAVGLVVAGVAQALFPLLVWIGSLRDSSPRAPGTQTRTATGRHSDALVTTTVRSTIARTLVVAGDRQPDRRHVLEALCLPCVSFVKHHLAISVLLGMMVVCALTGVAAAVLLLLDWPAPAAHLFSIMDMAQCLATLFYISSMVVEFHLKVARIPAAFVAVAILALVVVWRQVTLIVGLFTPTVSVSGDRVDLVLDVVVYAFAFTFKTWTLVSLQRITSGSDDTRLMLTWAVRRHYTELVPFALLVAKRPVFVALPPSATTSLCQVVYASALQVASYVHNSSTKAAANALSPGGRQTERREQQLRAVLRNPDAFRLFAAFCEANFCEENAAFWNEVAAYKDAMFDAMVDRTTPLDPATKATFLASVDDIFGKFLTPQSPQQVNLSTEAVRIVTAARQRLGQAPGPLSPSTAAGDQTTSLSSMKVYEKRRRARPDHTKQVQEVVHPDVWKQMAPMFSIFDNCLHEVFRLMSLDTFERFVKTKEYKSVAASIARTSIA